MKQYWKGMEFIALDRSEIEALSDHSAEVINILKLNGEQFTENQYGYIFDLNKLDNKTKLQLKTLNQTDPQPSMEFFSKQGGHDETQVRQDMPATDIPSKSFSISPKFISEYNADLQKLTVKPASMIKFLNAKKKYLRNSDNTVFTKIDLKKEVFT